MNRNALAPSGLTLDAGTGRPLPPAAKPIRRNPLAAVWQFLCMLALMACVFFGFTPKANAALVTYDGTNITWDTTAIATPLVAAIVAAIGLGVVVSVIWLGFRWIMKLAGGKK